MENQENNAGGNIPPKSSSAGKFITVIIIIALILGIGWYLIGRGGSSIAPATVPPPVTTSEGTTTAATTSKYKDGTYTAEGDYQVHVGPKHVTVTLTLQNDIVTDATVVGDPNTDPESVHFQGLFIGGFKQYVIGQNIDSLNLNGSISGSSLTPNGFNDAVAKIKAQAMM